MPRQQARQTEPIVNAALADLLKGMLPGCTVRAEHTRLVAGRSGLQLDNLITAPDRAPVVVEAEYLPAHTVEPEATARLGLPVVGEPNPIEAAVALRYPHDLGYADDLRTAIAEATLSYALFTQQGADRTRFPVTGWLTGSVADLADLIRLASVPQHAVDAAATSLEGGDRPSRHHPARHGHHPLGHCREHCPTAGHGRRVPDSAHGLCHYRQRPGVSRTVGRDARRGQAAAPGLRPVRGQPTGGHPDGLVPHSGHQLLGHLCHCPRSCRAVATRYRGLHPGRITRDGSEHHHHRRDQRPRPDRAYFSTLDCRPEVSGNLLHLTGVRGPAGPFGRRQAGQRGLVGYQRYRQAAYRRLCVWHGARSCPRCTNR